MCFVCLLAKEHSVFKWKDAIYGFPVLQGSAESLDNNNNNNNNTNICNARSVSKHTESEAQKIGEVGK